MGSQFPNQGSNPCVLLWKVDSSHWTIRGVPSSTTCICYHTWVSRPNVSFSNPQLPNAPSCPPGEELEIHLREAPRNQQADRLSLHKLGTMVDQV